MPLSAQTRLSLEKRLPDWPFRGMSKDNDMRGFEPDFAEWLLLANAYQLGLFEDLPVPTLAEGGCRPNETPVDDTTEMRLAIIAERIQGKIICRAEHGKSFSDLILKGLMYQWLYHSSNNDMRCPTVKQMANLMRISRQAFYRQFPQGRKEIEAAYYHSTGRASKSELPDLYGRDPVLKQNINAKTKIHEPEPDSDDDWHLAKLGK